MKLIQLGLHYLNQINQTTESIDDVTGASDTAGVTANLAGIDNHDRQPDRNYGYRVHLMLKDGSEVLSIRNCCFQEYSVSLGADAVQVGSRFVASPEASSHDNFKKEILKAQQ